MQATFIMRVYAMFQRLKKIPLFMSFLLFVEVVAILVTVGMDLSPDGPAKSVSEPILGIHMCTIVDVSKSLTFIYIPIMCFQCTLFVLAVWVGFLHVREQRRALGGWKADMMMKVLIRDSTFFFLFIFVMCTTEAGAYLGLPAVYMGILASIVNSSGVVLSTRMIINFRKSFSPSLGAQPGTEGVTLSTFHATFHASASDVQLSQQLPSTSCPEEHTNEIARIVAQVNTRY
ncbi:hypothetical protein SERLA73DRAFT_166079 [Serpula lacrymans var. lacrymans S7.3]|uniref:Uncharacterized protein n=2 Tax=Serpula lacrymans var. lacrymans TaxID=341189 RepID=F8PQC4_SERL3|nr:uncharacterized protein SERLADRAFT_460156 [Serpula lacrymans var. lacrymans S7.9]EGO01537.1 hypothetical protein SERLA73DRAFT_166079 [Serpula lacrymans var. lacrymans S7.3]EGO27191.1 hypothetical protein SERLADRAFT_460156 [Serpula lacrymans var. lacrymans S7.9]